MLKGMKLTGTAAEHVAKVEELYRDLTASKETAREQRESSGKNQKFPQLGRIFNSGSFFLQQGHGRSLRNPQGRG